MTLLKTPFRNLFDSNWFSENPFMAMEQMMSENNFPEIPPVNITETEQGFHLDFKVPGFGKEDFKISIDGDILTVSAETKSEHAEKKGQYTRKEFSHRSFKRSFTLPSDMLDEKVEAKYENGILKLVLLKKEKREKR